MQDNHDLPKGLKLTDDLSDVDWSQLKTDLNDDQFDNGRSAEQLRVCFEVCEVRCLVFDGDRLIAKARALSDGVCNGYIVDVWTKFEYRSQGIGEAMMRYLLDRMPGQHVCLLADDGRLYERVGFEHDNTGYAMVVGEWLRSKTE